MSNNDKIQYITDSVNNPTAKLTPTNIEQRSIDKPSARITPSNPLKK